MGERHGAAAGKARRWLADGKAVFPATDPGDGLPWRACKSATRYRNCETSQIPGTGAFEPVELASVLEPSLTAQNLAPAIRAQASEVITVIGETRLMRDKTGDVAVTKVDRGYLPDLSRLDRPLEDPQVSRLSSGQPKAWT